VLATGSTRLRARVQLPASTRRRGDNGMGEPPTPQP
jgi:hypothetical protein